MAAVNINRQRGFLLIEVLVALLITTVGLLGLAKLQATAQQAEIESYQRSQALVLVNEVVEHINANRYAANCFAFTTSAASGTPYLGADGADHAAAPVCASGTNPAAAVNAMTLWDQLLKGAAESSGGAQIGAIVGARGCVSFDAATNTYTVAVAWQGITDTVTPAVACAKGLYGAETKRRVVSSTLQIANLQ